MNTTPEDFGLVASRCHDCGHLRLADSIRCPSCWSDEHEPTPLSGHGTLYAFTVIHVSRPAFPAPCAVAYVDLTEGLRAFGQLDNWAAAAPGDRVRAYIAPNDDPGQPPRNWVRISTEPDRIVRREIDRMDHSDA